MLAKNSRPFIGKLVRIGFADPAASPRSPLDAKKGIKNYDHHLGGVGLGIVVALEKSTTNSGEVRPKNPVLVRNLSRSDPMPVSGERYRGYLDKMKLDWENLEDYTFVTRHEPNKSYTRVYCDRVEHDRRSRNVAVFDISPARFSDERTPPPAGHRESDFLSRCHLCQKKLHGKDIYMYRGEKAFCSTECRYRQIVTDERKEKKKKKQYCGSEASSRTSTAADISGSPYSTGAAPMFSTGILAV